MRQLTLMSAYDKENSQEIEELKDSQGKDDVPIVVNFHDDHDFDNMLMNSTVLH